MCTVDRGGGFSIDQGLPILHSSSAIHTIRRRRINEVPSRYVNRIVRLITCLDDSIFHHHWLHFIFPSSNYVFMITITRTIKDHHYWSPLITFITNHIIIVHHDVWSPLSLITNIDHYHPWSSSLITIIDQYHSWLSPLITILDHYHYWSPSLITIIDHYHYWSPSSQHHAILQTRRNRRRKDPNIVLINSYRSQQTQTNRSNWWRSTKR